jgi:hypothetical protein
MAQDPQSRKDQIRRAALARLAQERVREQHEAVWEANLIQAELDAAAAWLEEKWGALQCPYCHFIAWQVGTPVEIPLTTGDVFSPMFPVMCGNCGHTTFVNAIVAGLVPDPNQEQQ